MTMHPRVQALYDETPENLRPFVPIESLIDRASGDLIGIMMQKGSWTEQEKIDFHALYEERVDRMKPLSLRRLEKLLEPKPPSLPAPRPSFWRRIFG